MRLRYIGTPGAYVDLDTRTKWNPGDVRDTPSETDAHRLLGTGLFQVVSDELKSEDKQERTTRRK